MKAFLTGSRTYGTEQPDSDIDLVVFMDEQTKQGLLEAQGGRCPDSTFSLGTESIRSNEEPN